jgi:hypothetical protein
MLELLKLMKEHEETDKTHREFYELAEKYGFCSPWCHLNRLCSNCENREVENCSTELCCV